MASSSSAAAGASHGMNGVKPMDVFPDLHHKMSKKIAQLTKVIYHLNTRNEDHQSELDSLSANHQIEIQQVLRDAASRIGKFKEMMESRQSTVNVEVQLTKLQKKHDSEKQAALQEMQSLKEKLSGREAKIAKEYQQKFDGMRGDIEKMNSKFQEKIDTFDNANQDLKKQLETARKAGSSELVVSREKFERELAEAIRIGNEKYQQLLIEQLLMQENLKKEADKQAAMAVAAAEESWKVEMEKRLGQIRAELSGDKQEALMTQKREFESKLQTQREEFMAKLERALADLRDKNLELDNFRAENNQTVADLRAKIAELQRNMSDQVGGQSKQIDSLSSELRTTSEQIIKLKGEVGEKDATIKKLEALLGDKSAQLTQTEEFLRTAESQISKLNAELENAKATGASSEADLMTRLTNAERDAASLRGEVNSMGQQIANAREELKVVKAAASKASQESEKAVATLNAEKETLQQKLKEALQASNFASSSLSQQLSELQKQLSDQANIHRTELAQMDETHRKSLELLRDKQRTEVDSMNQEKKSLMDAAVLRENSLKQLAISAAEEHMKKIVQQKAEFEEIIEANRIKAEDEIAALKLSLSTLETQMQSLSDQADGEKGKLRTEMDKLNEKTKNLQKELENKKKEFERAESVQNGLKSQIESLREELKATQKAFQDKLEITTAKLNADWQAKMDALIAENSSSLGNVLEDIRNSHKRDMDDLTKAHAEEVSMLKQTLQQEANRAQEESVKAETERVRLVNELRSEKENSNNGVNSLMAKHAAEIKKIESANKFEMDKLKKELLGSAEAREVNLMSEFDTEKKSLFQKAEEAAVLAAERLAQEIDNAKRNLIGAVASAVAENEVKCSDEKKVALDDMARKHEAFLAEVTSENVKAYNKISGELEASKSNHAYAQQQAADLSKQLSDERTERQRREEKFILDKDEMGRMHENEIKKEKDSAERGRNELIEKFNNEFRLLRQESDDEKRKFEERYKLLQSEYVSLETRYRNRESRPEDLEKIRQLEMEMIEKDELVEKTREEMVYFKREMLNREENYNQKFGRTPNIGVMDPLASKAKDKEPASRGPPKPASNKPTYALPAGGPGAGAMMSMSAGGLGLGGGGGSGPGGGSGLSGTAPSQSMKSTKK
jgi:predicted  nucleic acid-binding Zn-ribbon protein